jgi:hypothetical protein
MRLRGQQKAMAAARADRSRDGDRMLKSATADKMRRAAEKQVTSSALSVQWLSLLHDSWAADATKATLEQASVKAEAEHVHYE